MSKRRAALRHPQRVPSYDTGVGYCRPDSVDGAWSECLAAVQEHDWLHDRRIIQRSYIESGPRIAPARNRIIAKWLLDPKVQWGWMQDVDMTFTPDILDRMLAVADPVDVPILGALCFAGGRDFRIIPTIYAANPDAPPGELNFEVQFDYPRDALVKCHGTGAACLLIHRSVMEALYEQNKDRTVYPWFAETEIPPVTIDGVRHPGGDIGEDITFCLRAGKLGFPIHVHTGIQTGHRKKVTLDEAMYVANRTHIEQIGEEQAQAESLRKLGVVA